ncbi:hypothetical protein [Desulfogranum marinum]|uniref:hypothetical protein n=1 Tax=Desulfogranum marinum TaxID=453220 RepID=UPI001966584C|nr:hypothetical protein [Desulfogranum marinum]MBM9514723.1 hypothetical protein [Desulfogranum marinum]
MAYKIIGLREDNPQGWMAAVGLLYILNKMDIDALMMWCDGFPTLPDLTDKQVIDALWEYLQKGSDLPENLPQPKPGNNKISLDLTAGRVNFLGVIKQMIQAVTLDDIKKALNRRWVNQDDVTSLGWDTGAVKMAANIGGMKAPDSSPHRGVIAGQWLAAESLPFTGTGTRSSEYKWVTWSVPLDLEGVRSLVLSLSTEWGGVVYSSSVGRNGKMGYLEPARTMSKQK